MKSARATSRPLRHTPNAATVSADGFYLTYRKITAGP